MALKATKRGRFMIFENLGEVTKEELETLRAETRRLAKVANQRLVRLEKESPFGTSPAYKRAKEDLRTEFGAPRNRYRESVKSASREELIREYRSLREFVTSKSSTVAGYEKIVRDRYERYKKQTGAEISIEDYVAAWEKLGADSKAKDLFYKSQFKLIKNAAAKWQDAKLAAEARGEKPETSFQDILAEEMKAWSGKKFIQTLRGDVRSD